MSIGRFRPRFSVRRLMVVVALVAAFSAGCLEAGKWYRYSSAIHECEKAQELYSEGRVTLSHCVEKSRELMDAALAVCLTRNGKVAAIQAHIARTTCLAEAERNEPLVPHGGPNLADIAEAEDSMSECKKLLKRLAEES